MKNLPVKHNSLSLTMRCRYSTLKALCESYASAREQKRKLLNILCEDSRVQAVLDELQVTVNDFEQLVMDFSDRKKITVDITAEAFDLLDALDADSAVLAKIDRATVKKYARRLYSKVHPDRPGGDANVFHAARQLEKAGSVEALYLMLIGSDFSEADDTALTNMIQSMRGRIDKLPAANSWRVSYAYLAKGKEQAILELVTQIQKKTQRVKDQILGVERGNNSD